MKTSIYQTIVPNSNNFIKNVRKLIPEGIKELYVIHVSMERASGYGSYNYKLGLNIDGEEYTFKQFTHDSMSFDEYQDLEYGSHTYNNWAKGCVLAMLDHDPIKDDIIEIIYNNQD